MNSKRFEQNIIDNIREAQLKIGYDERPISFNYFSASLCHMLGTDAVDDDILCRFAEYAAPRLGEITYRPIKDGWCITVSAQGTAYVHNTPDKSGFLADFIAVVSCHGITMDDVLDVFRRYSDKITVREINNDEFDLLVYFTDGVPDDYRYCLTAEPCSGGGVHVTYHRFIPEDYEDFGF